MILVHLTILFITGFFIVVSDYAAFKWVTGKVQTLNLVSLKRNHWAVGIGLTLMILTGSFMAFGGSGDRMAELFANPAFWVKMSFVALLIINSFVIGAHLKTPAERPFASLTAKEKWPLYISGAVSTFAWVGAIVCATLLGD